jgi:hypothetical protein
MGGVECQRLATGLACPGLDETALPGKLRDFAGDLPGTVVGDDAAYAAAVATMDDNLAIEDQVGRRLLTDRKQALARSKAPGSRRREPPRLRDLRRRQGRKNLAAPRIDNAHDEILSRLAAN